MNKVIDWSRIEKILKKYYKVGISTEGTDVYPHIVEQYFGLSHLHDKAKRARFTTIIKNTIDAMFRQFAFNINRGSKLLGFT